MTKDLWINLPVSDVRRAREFFTRVGFSPDEKLSSDEMACFSIGEKGVKVVFFPEKTFEGFTRSEISDASAGAEVLLSFDAESREEVDRMAGKVWEAGGSIFGAPAEIQGWMYGFGFADPDGHRWNMVFMDFDKLSEKEV